MIGTSCIEIFSLKNHEKYINSSFSFKKRRIKDRRGLLNKTVPYFFLRLTGLFSYSYRFYLFILLFINLLIYLFSLACLCYFGAVKFCFFGLFPCFVYCFNLYFSSLCFPCLYFPFFSSSFPWYSSFHFFRLPLLCSVHFCPHLMNLCIVIFVY